ncbi:MAG: nucleotidyl transferase AbiEii/AbiGii toxin family protein [Streptosporangiaceae bacterium]
MAAIALRAAAPHGFALGGGNALIAHGLIDRATQDVDVFSDEQGGVEAAADAVEEALLDAGLRAERRDKAAGLSDLFPGMGEGLAEWIVTAHGGEQMMLQLAYFDRTRSPVIMDVGPVLDLERHGVRLVRTGPGGHRRAAAQVHGLAAELAAGRAGREPARLSRQRPLSPGFREPIHIRKHASAPDSGVSKPGEQDRQTPQRHWIIKPAALAGWRCVPPMSARTARS